MGKHRKVVMYLEDGQFGLVKGLAKRDELSVSSWLRNLVSRYLRAELQPRKLKPIITTADI